MTSPHCPSDQRRAGSEGAADATVNQAADGKVVGDENSDGAERGDSVESDA